MVFSLRYRLLLTGLLMISSGGSIADEWEFVKRVNFGITYTDNLSLAPEGEQEDEYIGRLSPVLELIGEGNSAKFSLSAGLDYKNNIKQGEDFLDPVFLVSGIGAIFDKRALVNASFGVTQVGVDSSGSLTSEIDGSEDLSNVYGLKVGTYITRDFGSANNFNARYTFSSVDVVDEEIADRIGHEIEYSLSHSPRVDGLVWGFESSFQKIDTTIDQETSELKTADASATIGFLFLSDWVATISAGREWTRLPDADETETSDIWDAHLLWRPNERISLDIGYGRRKFGENPSVELEVDTKRGRLKMAWSRNIAQPAQLFDDIFDPQLDTEADQLVPQLEETETNADTDIQNIAVGNLQNLSSINDRFNIAYALQGRRTDLLLSGAYIKQDDREIENESWEIQLGVLRRFQGTFSTAVIYTHTEKLSDVEVPGYVENQIEFTFKIDL